MRKPRYHAVLIVLIAALSGHAGSLSVEITGNRVYSDDYLSGLLNRRGHQNIETVIRKIIYLYNNSGYPFCRIKPEIVHGIGLTTRVILHVNEGDFVMISDYLYRSGGRTSARALKRYVRGKTNTAFSLHTVNAIRDKLLDTGIFEKIVENIVRQDYRYYLQFSLQERRSDYMSLLGSYGEGDFNIFASVLTRNLLGTLRGLQFDYEHERTFSLVYHDPISLVPVTLDGKFLLLTEDSARLNEFGVRLSVPVNRFIDIGISSGHESASHETNPSANYRSNSAGLGAGLRYRDNPLAFQSKIGFDYLFRANDRRRFSYDGSVDIKHLMIAFHYRFVWTDSFNYFDYYRIGGAHNLRGYREDEFFARKARWFTIEYHRLPVFPMIDIGYVNDDFQFSYGFGINARGRNAAATLIIAWPWAKNWQQGKIHLLLATGF